AQQQTDRRAVRHGHRAGGAELLIMSSAFPMTVIPRKRRGIELVLLIFALAITLGAYALFDLKVNIRLPPMFPYIAAGGVVLAGLAHLAVRWRLPYAD